MKVELGDESSEGEETSAKFDDSEGEPPQSPTQLAIKKIRENYRCYRYEI